MIEIDTATLLCAVIGNPVTHSLSPAMHNAAFRACQLNHVYLAFAISNLEAFLTGMRAMPSFRGLSITIPHKIEAMRHVDEVDELAQKVGCINTITQEKGRLLGTITDGLGTLRAFQDANIDLSGKRILFLGSGGAVRAVAFAMAEKAQVAKITVLGRSQEKVNSLSGDLRHSTVCKVMGGELEADTKYAMKNHDVIIQGTPMGMYPNNMGISPVGSDCFEPRHIAFDMVYRPQKTQFIADAEAAGCKTVLGMEMLVNQAEMQFETWTGINAPREVMRDALIRQLSRQ